MLLPYQPDYKEQLKVPGTGVCNSTNAAYTHNSSQHACSQQLHWSNYHMGSIDSCGGGVNWPKTNRPRVNSAIDVASFLSQEFLRRHGSTSRLCRKVRSADNLPLVLSNQQNSDVSDCISTNGDREIFLKSNQDDNEKSDDTETQQNAQDKTKNDSSLYEFSSTEHQSSSDDLKINI
ncbi:PREDICTED: uncharacterized protein LOC105366553 [Ceratosolen solmsi marchali]|uniref:Uncharacterized protein LOC105366553 n=1 Tax=Ceratosolen solmsi marchali TaxID=326594 RepID=A0AAJ6YS98_9HYME|nr:PREDICTED: uncharacterized protein LOC105366553 [Ceratosolen solmsi marchali]